MAGGGKFISNQVKLKSDVVNDVKGCVSEFLTRLPGEFPEVPYHWLPLYIYRKMTKTLHTKNTYGE